MKKDKRNFDLIVTILAKGYAGKAMEAARHGGAWGGTILSARGSGIHETEKFLGINIEPEKEVLLILVKHSEKKNIMEALVKASGLATPGRGISFSLPVEDVAGITHMIGEFDASPSPLGTGKNIDTGKNSLGLPGKNR